jgi:FlaA1/EpsC-like NDP-sugar epimerase
MFSKLISSRSVAAGTNVTETPLANLARTGAASTRSWLTAPATFGRQIIVLMAELGLVAMSYLVNVRFFSATLHAGWATTTVASVLPLLVICRGMGFLAFDTWLRSLRFAGVADVIAIGKSVAASGLASYAISWVLQRTLDLRLLLPAAFFLSDGITLFLLLVALHFSVRFYNSARQATVADAKRVVVVGAGDAGAAVARDLLSGSRTGIRPVALVDDDPRKRGTRICGIAVEGDTQSLAEIVLKFHASEVLVCIPSMTEGRMRQILSLCLKAGVPVRTLPSVSQLVNGRVSWRDLRSIEVEDVLRRERFRPDRSRAQRLVEDKVVLVTGAGGSIGSELCRQVAAGNPKQLLMLDKAENSLFYSHMGIEEAHPALEVVPLLADIADRRLVHDLMLQYQPNLVFHAAAFKHVRMMELHPEQAIRNNVLGTRNVLEAALEARTEVVVNVSTDKAVKPRNYMGLSKKIAEFIVQEFASRHGARFMNVRFGNVAGSTGSVLRIFSDNISSGKPLRITDPRATRYFMSIPQAVYLILCAATLGQGGETFILDMGDPVNIYELARTVSLLSGVTPGEELPIEFTGLRDGEKIHEELWETWEHPQLTENPHILKLTGASPFPLDAANAAGRLEELLCACDRQNLLDCIAEIAPDFALQRAPFSVWRGSAPLNLQTNDFDNFVGRRQ